MSADDVRPTVPAIPLRQRQRHKPRVKKTASSIQEAAAPAVETPSMAAPAEPEMPEMPPQEMPAPEAVSLTSTTQETAAESESAEAVSLGAPFAEPVDAEPMVYPAAKLPLVTEVFAEKIEEFFRSNESIPPVVETAASESSALEREEREDEPEPLLTPPPIALSLDGSDDATAPDVLLDGRTDVFEGRTAIASSRRRRMLGRIVGAAVFASSLLCVGALLRTVEHANHAAPAAAVRLPQSPAAIEAPPAAATLEAPANAAVDLREEARALLINRKIDEAIVVGRRAVEADPTDATAWLILGAAQMDANHLSDANATFRACAEQATTGPVSECRSFVR